MQLLQSKDTWLGLFLTLSGGWMYNQSMGFDSTSRTYPMLLSALILALGLIFIFQVVRNRDSHSESVKEMVAKIRGPFFIIALMSAWVASISFGVGYLLSSLLSVFFILMFIGEGNKMYCIKTTAIIVSSVCLLFSIIFDVPLPLNEVTEQILM